MAPITKSLALAATAFAALSAAAPGHAHKHHHKRDAVTVWETQTTVVWTTVDVTTTITAGQEAPASTTVKETVNEATAPAQPASEVDDEKVTSIATSTATSTATATSTSTSTAEPAPAPASVEEKKSVETNVQVAQTTTQAPAPAPTTTTTQAPAPVETQAAESEPEPTTKASSGSSGSSGPCSESSPCKGQITFYDTATSMSAPSSCGTTNDGSSENVIALPVGIMKDSDCGRQVTISYGGKKTTGTVVDKCMGCDDTSIDLSRHFFQELASFTEGRLFGVEWYLN